VGAVVIWRGALPAVWAGITVIVLWLLLFSQIHFTMLFTLTMGRDPNGGGWTEISGHVGCVFIGVTIGRYWRVHCVGLERPSSLHDSEVMTVIPGMNLWGEKPFCVGGFHLSEEFEGAGLTRSGGRLLLRRRRGRCR